jgi:uncharacterized protein YqfB (UPF0267 family)
MQDYITVKINRSELEQMLAVMLENSSKLKSQLLAKVICENIAGTECGLNNLYLAMNGLEKNYKYRVGDIVSINKSNLYHWKLNDDAMSDSGMMINNQIRAEIVEIHPHKNAPYQVKYKYIHRDDNKIAEQEGIFVEESSLIIDDIYPLEN